MLRLIARAPGMVTSSRDDSARHGIFSGHSVQSRFILTQRRAQIVRHSGHDRSWPIDVERAVLLVELQRRAGYWSLFARRCVGGRKQQREHSNCNCGGKTGATSEEKLRDEPI